MIKAAMFRKKLVFMATALVVMVLPFSITGTSIAIILLMLAWIIEGEWRMKMERLKSNTLFFTFISLFFIQVIGLLYTENMSKGNSELEKKLSLLLFPLVLASTGTINLKRTVIIFKAFVLSCFLAVLICLVHATYKTLYYDTNSKSINWDLITIDDFNKSNTDYSHRWDAFTYMEFSRIVDIHPTYFSLYLLFSILILIYLLTSFPLRRPAKIAYSSISALFFITLILLAARIILLVTVLLVIFFIIRHFVMKNQVGKIFIYSSVFVGLLALLVYSIPFTKYRLIDQLNADNFKFPDHHDKWNSTNLRIAQWHCSFDTFQKNPVIGVGTGDFQDFLQQCYQTLDLGPFYKVYNSHNQYLQIATSNGLLGLLIFIGCLIMPMRYRIPSLYLQFLIVVAACSLTESILQNQKGIVFYALFNSLMAFGLTNQKAIMEEKD